MDNLAGFLEKLTDLSIAYGIGINTNGELFIMEKEDFLYEYEYDDVSNTLVRK